MDLVSIIRKTVFWKLDSASILSSKDEEIPQNVCPFGPLVELFTDFFTPRTK